MPNDQRDSVARWADTYFEEAMAARAIHKGRSHRLFFDDQHPEDMVYVHACALTEDAALERDHA